MTSVNELNERTRSEKKMAYLQDAADRFAALIIATYRLPIEVRKSVLAQYEANYEKIVVKRAVEEVPCDLCNGEGLIEIMGDGVNFEWDVIGTKPCPHCFPEKE